MDAGPLVDRARRPLLRNIARCLILHNYTRRRHKVALDTVSLIWQPLVRHQSVLVHSTLHLTLRKHYFLGRWLWVSLRLQFTEGVRHEFATRQGLLVLWRPDRIVKTIFLVRLIRVHLPAILDSHGLSVANHGMLLVLAHFGARSVQLGHVLSLRHVLTDLVGATRPDVVR